MQGRLSEVIDGKIQAFPWQFWKEEFEQASEIDIPLMEWTLDQLDLYSNPLMTADGQKKIIQLSEDNDVKIIIDKKSFLYLIGTTLEYSGGLNGKGFIFNNPNANRTCGCGESFSL